MYFEQFKGIEIQALAMGSGIGVTVRTEEMPAGLQSATL
jgi:hypothetical protein